jgi:hypothetical protein
LQPAIRFHTPAPRSVFRVSPRKSGSGQSTEAAEADRSYVSAVPETRRQFRLWPPSLCAKKADIRADARPSMSKDYSAGIGGRPRSSMIPVGNGLVL